jgi:hypothetical protein
MDTWMSQETNRERLIHPSDGLSCLESKKAEHHQQAVPRINMRHYWNECHMNRVQMSYFAC